MPIRPNILVIGETCLDQYVHCNVTRLSPEAPTPVVVPVSRAINDGMAGNVIANILSLGWPVEQLISLTPPKSISKTRYVDNVSGYILLRVDEGEPLAKKDEFTLDRLDTLDLSKVAVCVISDYCKGFLSESTISDIVRRMAEERVPVICDTKKILGEWSKGIDIVKINWKEYQNQLAHGVSRPSKYCKNLVVTRGGEGCWWANKDCVMATQVVDVRDVTGAGDSFAAAFAVSYATNGSVIDAMKYGNAVAAVAVSKRGVVAVKREEVA